MKNHKEKLLELLAPIDTDGEREKRMLRIAVYLLEEDKIECLKYFITGWFENCDCFSYERLKKVIKVLKEIPSPFYQEND